MHIAVARRLLKRLCVSCLDDTLSSPDIRATCRRVIYFAPLLEISIPSRISKSIPSRVSMRLLLRKRSALLHSACTPRRWGVDGNNICRVRVSLLEFVVAQSCGALGPLIIFSTFIGNIDRTPSSPTVISGALHSSSTTTNLFGFRNPPAGAFTRRIRRKEVCRFHLIRNNTGKSTTDARHIVPSQDVLIPLPDGRLAMSPNGLCYPWLTRCLTSSGSSSSRSLPLGGQMTLGRCRP